MNNPEIKRIKVRMLDIYPLILDCMNNGESATFVVSGTSMQPMIYNRRDSVVIKKPTFPLKKYEIPLFRMDDGKFILHRVIRIHNDGTYECRGDNRWVSEDNIRDDQVIGVVSEFVRNGKKVTVNNFWYMIYVRIWKFLHPFKKYYSTYKKIKNFVFRK